AGAGHVAHRLRGDGGDQAAVGRAALKPVVGDLEGHVAAGARARGQQLEKGGEGSSHRAPFTWRTARPEGASRPSDRVWRTSPGSSPVRSEPASRHNATRSSAA